MTLLAAAALAGVAAAAAWRAHALTSNGALAALAVGMLVASAGGPAAVAALLAFFVSSTAISRLQREVPARVDPKQGPRDAGQVLANGGPAAAGATIAAAGGLDAAATWIAACSLAVAGADTWATAVGSRSVTPPRHILTRLPVPRGASGGVTRAGTLAALGGAAIPGIAAGLVARDTALLMAAVIIGWTGMLADSILGATVQGRFHCPRCDVPSEWRRHRCGAGTTLVGGLGWLTNDGVNAAATALGALLGAAAWGWFVH